MYILKDCSDGKYLPRNKKKIFTKKKVRSKKVIANHLQMLRSVFILLQKSKSRTFSKHLNQKKRIRTGFINFFFSKYVQVVLHIILGCAACITLCTGCTAHHTGVCCVHNSKYVQVVLHIILGCAACITLNMYRLYCTSYWGVLRA